MNKWYKSLQNRKVALVLVKNVLGGRFTINGAFEADVCAHLEA